jgi:cytidine deaminase
MSNAKKKDKKKVDKAIEIRRWDAVALWHWGGEQVERCAICRNHIMHLCMSKMKMKKNENEIEKKFAEITDRLSLLVRY